MTDPTLIEALRRFLEPATMGDSMQPLLRISKNNAMLPAALCAMQYDIGKSSISKILMVSGYRRQCNREMLVSWQEPYAQAAAQMVRRLGFQVTHTTLDDIGAQRRLGQYDWDICCMASGPRADVFLRWVRLMSDGPNPVLWGGIQDPELDAMIRAAAAEPALGPRREKYARAWARMAERHYFIVLGHAANQIAWRREVQGFSTGFTWSPHRRDGGIGVTSLE